MTVVDAVHLLDRDALAVRDTSRYPRTRLLFKKLQDSHGRPFVALVGPRGTGKTVMLRQLRARTKDALYGWVALGGYPPRAPTDPDVRNSRIRLLGVEDSLLSVQSVHDSGWCKRVPGQEPSKRLPGPVSGMRASSQPFPPQAFHLAAKAAQ